MINKNTLLEKLAELELNQYDFIDPNIINFSEEVKNMCAVNTCGKYGTNWQCPPGVGNLEENKKQCLSFENALLFNTVTAIEDSFDFEGMTEAGAVHREKTFKIRDIMYTLSGDLDFLMLGAGGCSICERCTYLDNEACRYPDKVMSSMEAYGIYVVELCPATGFKYINGTNTVTYFSLILF